MEIFVMSNNEQKGPYKVEEANRLLANGELQISTQAWFQGATGWVPLRQVPGIMLAVENPTAQMAFILCWVGILFCPLIEFAALLMALKAKQEIVASQGQQTGEKKATIALIVSGVFLSLIFLIIVLAILSNR